MTEPRLRRRNHGKGHSYLLDEKKSDGVTTVINGGLPKPALINWAAEATAEAAVDRWDELAAMPLSKRLRELKQARWNVTKAAQTRGTDIHNLAEGLSHGRPVDVPDELVGPVEAVAGFLDYWDIQIIGTEAPCANTELGYCGTLDAIGTIGRLGTGPALIDWKTGYVGNESCLQLGAYWGCDIWQPDGPESEQPMPELEGLYIAKILPDDVQLIPVVEPPEKLLLQFRYVMATHRWLARVKDDPALGAALDPSEYRQPVAG